jgi:hypothetical protein
LKNKYTVICDDIEILDIFLDFMYTKKYLKKILQKNDKFQPYYGIIEMSLSKSEIENIIRKKFRNAILLR